MLNECFRLCGGLRGGCGCGWLFGIVVFVWFILEVESWIDMIKFKIVNVCNNFILWVCFMCMVFDGVFRGFISNICDKYLIKWKWRKVVNLVGKGESF